MRARPILFGTMLTLFWAACSDPADVEQSIAGFYALESVNGAPVPYELSNGQTLVSGSYTIREEGTVRWVHAFEEDGVSVGQSVADGTWSQAGDRISFSFSGGAQFDGTLSGNTLTVQETTVLVYRKSG